MKKRVRILFLFVSVVITLSMISSTYSRYVADTTGTVDVSLSKWQILVNETDIVQNASSTIEFTPHIEQNNNVTNNTLAPTSTGYFDIEVDPTNVDLSFRYSIELSSASTDVPDFIINKYEILEGDTLVSNPLNIINISNGIIENTLLYNSNVENYIHEKFTIRVYFEWFDGDTNIMTDEQDTEVGNRAAIEDLKVAIQANVTFEQVI